ncbi:hypothetical protein ACFLTK_05375 [Chloroflexota bacterium]
METNFSVGDKVRMVGKIAEDEIYFGKTGVIIKDAGVQNMGFRELGKAIGESKGNKPLKQWLVKLDDTGTEMPFFEGSLEKIT